MCILCRTKCKCQIELGTIRAIPTWNGSYSIQEYQQMLHPSNRDIKFIRKWVTVAEGLTSVNAIDNRIQFMCATDKYIGVQHGGN